METTSSREDFVKGADDESPCSKRLLESQKRSVYLRSPNSLQILTMESISRNRDIYENNFAVFRGFNSLTPPCLQMLIEHIVERTDRFLTPQFAKMLYNGNCHYANIGSVDERFRQDLYNYVIKHCCALRLKIIRSLWVDSNLNVALHHLIKFKNLHTLELLQLECSDEVLQEICINFPNLQSLAVTFKDEYVSEDGIGCLATLQCLQTFTFKVDEEDACYYKRMLEDFKTDAEMNLQIKQFVVSGLKRRIVLADKSVVRKPVTERIGSFLKKKIVRAFSREIELN